MCQFLSQYVIQNYCFEQQPSTSSSFFFVLFACSMSDETLDITNTSSKDATINLLNFDANRNSNNQCILSILSLLLCFVANKINDNDNSCPSTRNIIQQICVVRLATAILWQKWNADSIDESSGSQANVKGGIHPIWLGLCMPCCSDRLVWPPTLFNDLQFEQVFWITHDLADQLLVICGNALPMFQENCDATRKQTICPKAKLLYCLKLLAYGCSPSAFQDYFQMGLTMIWKAFVEFTKIISTSKDLCQAFLEKWQRQMYDMSQQCI